MKLFVTLGICALVATVPLRARADEPERSSEREDLAKAAVRRGLAAFARGDAETALDEYRKAQVLVPDANVPYRYAAEALVQLGRKEEAIQSLERYLSLKRDVSDAETVRSRINALRAELSGTLVVTCDVARITAGVDGAVAEERACPFEVTVTPGPHVLDVYGENQARRASRFVIAKGMTTRLALHLETHAPAPPPLPVADHAPTNTRRIAGFVALGVGGAFLASGLVFDIALLGPAIDGSRTAAERGDPHAADEQRRARTVRVATIAMYGAATAALVTGTILVVGSRRATVKGAVSPRGDLLFVAGMTF